MTSYDTRTGINKQTHGAEATFSPFMACVGKLEKEKFNRSKEEWNETKERKKIVTQKRGKGRARAMWSEKLFHSFSIFGGDVWGWIPKQKRGKCCFFRGTGGEGRGTQRKERKKTLGGRMLCINTPHLTLSIAPAEGLAPFEWKLLASIETRNEQKPKSFNPFLRPPLSSRRWLSLSFHALL